MTDERPDAAKLLAIYLRDHRAGAAAGVRLVRRCRAGATSPDVVRTMEWLEGQVDEDGRTLDAVMDRLGVEPAALKSVLGVVAERAGRLKLNGRLWNRSPLSTLVELEALASATVAKRNLWSSLTAVEGDADGGDPTLFRRLIIRATEQLDRIQADHDAVARRLFPSAGNGPVAEHVSSSAVAPNASTAAPNASTAAPLERGTPHPGPNLDQVLADAEGGIEGSTLDAPDDPPAEPG